MSELTCALGPDSAGTLVTRFMREARSSLDVAMYEVGPSYAWLIAAAARRGVRVRLLLDAHASDGNASTVRTVTRAGGECRVLGRGAVAAHWKLVCVDGRRVGVGTGNLLWRDAPRDRHGLLPPRSQPLRGTREWWALTDAETVWQSAAEGMDIAWDRARRPPIRWFTSPEVSPWDVGAPPAQVAPVSLCADERNLRLVVGGIAVGVVTRRLISTARRRVLLTAPYVHTDAIGVRPLMASLQRSRGRGVDVRILLGARPERRDAARLTAAGLTTRWMDAAVATRGHAKGLVADDAVLITSANWSTAGLGRNWEAGLVARDAAAAAYFAAAWERDWALAEPV